MLCPFFLHRSCTPSPAWTIHVFLSTKAYFRYFSSPCNAPFSYTQVVHAITGTTIVVEPPPSTDVMDLQEFYELIEKHRIENIDRLVKKYRNISPLLGKIEEVRICAFLRT